MALRREAEIGARVMIACSPKYAAPTRAYLLHGKAGEVIEYSGPQYDQYTVQLDRTGEVITLSGVHLTREDVGYGRKSRS